MTPPQHGCQLTKVTKDSNSKRTNASCKTCLSCRQKKLKCDGCRPVCHECEVNQLDCFYPRDARREARPSQARVQSLESTVALMLEHMRASGIVPPNIPEALALESDLVASHMPSQGLSQLASTAAIASPLPTPAPTMASIAHPDDPAHIVRSPTQSDTADSTYQEASMQDSGMPGMDSTPSLPTANRSDYYLPSSTAAEHVSVEDQHGTLGDVQRQNGDRRHISSLSPCEARVAGVFHEHGCVSSVHGLAGIMNPTSRERHKQNISKLTWRGETAITTSKARLISNAALQKQREVRMFRQPQNLLDLDGCDPELARHLLDMHFNRQHYAYLVSYRPAIMDSLASGGGPWANKLLLNAIFYSSALYSDRECLRADPGDPGSIGGRFYKRFRELLIDEMDNPSIPSAVALLLTSATLVSQGRSSAGWTLSGTAYRMVIDLGCHMTLGPNYQSTDGPRSGKGLRRDLDQEMRKRLYWGAYVTDATQALYLGRPCMFASVEARVPLQFLDTFEELEDWEPYTDHGSMLFPPPAYAPQPAHAISTFLALTRLLRISTKITELYGIQSVKVNTDTIRDRKHSIEWELSNWSTSLPNHLRFDPDGASIPPPHQVTPLTTYHALTILLHRAFLEQGHLRRHSDETSKKSGEEACIRSALMIEKYVRAYRNTFTLRRAPFLLSYAIYSAVTVILHQERHDRGKFTKPISFFWTCLSELQRGCNFGLKKPLVILQDMAHEFQVSVQDGTMTELEQQLQPSLQDSLFFALPNSQQSLHLSNQTPGSSGNGVSPDYLAGINGMDAYFGASPSGLLDFLNDQEENISQDPLYGLFAPS